MNSKATAPYRFDFSSREGCLKALAECAEAVTAGSLDPKRASCVGYLVYRAMLAHFDPRTTRRGSRPRARKAAQEEDGSYEAMIASLGPDE